MAGDTETARKRSALAQRIASFIVEDTMSWSQARTRALEETGQMPGALPSGDEIETAVRAHLALFEPEQHALTLARKRRLALCVLELFREYEAYLTGAVLNGAAVEESPVCIEVVADDIKSVMAVVLDAGFDIEALDAQASPFSRAFESLGFVTDWEGVAEAVRIDVIEERCARSNPARRKADAYQEPWEASGRISAENLRNHLEKRISS